MSDDASDPNTGNSADNSVTVTTTQGLGNRLGQSVAGMIVGLVLIIGSVVALSWNEGRAVTASRALAEGASEVIEASAATPSPAAEGHLVHVVGMIAAGRPARDPVFGSAGGDTLRLRRTVEMYQWKEDKSSSSTTSFGGSKTTETTYSYHKVWSDQAIDSQKFHEANNHRNPQMPLASVTVTGESVKLGAYAVDPGVTAQLIDFTPIPPLTDVPPNLGYRADGDHLYRGDGSANPAIGDLRVSFAAVSAETVSVVAAQAGGRLAPYRMRNGYVVALAKPGVAAADDLFGEKRHEESRLTWIIRGAGFAAMFIGFCLLMQPLAVLASILPFLGGIMSAGTALVAFALAVPLTLLTIAIAWFAHRPVLGIVLLVAGLAVPIALHFRPRAATRAAALAPAPAGPVAAAPAGGSVLTGWMQSGGNNPPPRAGEGS